MLSLAAALRLGERREDRYGGSHRGDLVAENIFHGARPTLRALRSHHSRHPLDNRIVSGLVDRRPRESVAGNRAIDNFRIARRHRVVADAQPIDDSRTHVLHDDVRVLRHLEKHFGGAGLLEVEHHGALVAIPIEDADRHAAALPAGQRARYVAFGRLDLDYVRPEVAEHHGAERSRHHHAHIEYANSFQWSHRRLREILLPEYCCSGVAASDAYSSTAIRATTSDSSLAPRRERSDDRPRAERRRKRRFDAFTTPSRMCRRRCAFKRRRPFNEASFRRSAQAL